MGNEFRQRLGGLAPVLLDVDDDVGGRERLDALELDVLGPADLGDRPHEITRVVSLLMLEFADNGQLENLAAMGTALMLITLLLVASSFRLIGRDFMVGRFG